MDYVLLTVLLLSAIFIVVAVLFQKSGDEGLSSTIAGGNETYFGKDKTPNAEKVWFKWTLIVGIIFAVAVLAVYIYVGYSRERSESGRHFLYGAQRQYPCCATCTYGQ